MASVFRRDGCWYLRVKDATGRWTKIRVEGAKTKTEAKRLAAELDRRNERQRLGLDQLPPDDGGGTLRELLEWWLAEVSAGTPSHEWAERTVRGHLLTHEIAALPLAAVTPERIEGLLLSKAKGLGPQTLNHLRAFLSRAFSAARKIGRWAGPNPAAEVQKRRVPRRAPDFLRVEEVPAVLRALDSRWRALFATAIFTGLRKGELAALAKSDVDLASRLLTVRYSWDRDSTKGGHADVIPIAAEAAPWLELAIRASPSELVFPGAGGEMMRRDVKLQSILRRALGRAGIVTGYGHVCRARVNADGKRDPSAKRCKHVEAAPDDAPRRCPTHGDRLWPKPRVRPIRFHDLRHTTASLLLMSGADLIAVQRVLRHEDPKTTAQTYGHLVPGYLKSQVDRLRFGVRPEGTSAPAADVPVTTEAPSAAAVNAGPFVPVVSPTARPQTPRAGAAEENSQRIRPSRLERRTGFEPATPSLGSHAPVRPTVTSASQPAGTSRAGGPPGVQRSQPFSAVAKDFVPVVSPSPSVRVLTGGAERLLSVRQVAERLGVCTAVVYRLVERGELPHVRVSNAVRIAPADLAAFVARRAPSAK